MNFVMPVVLLNMFNYLIYLKSLTNTFLSSSRQILSFKIIATI